MKYKIISKICIILSIIGLDLTLIIQRNEVLKYIYSLTLSDIIQGITLVFITLSLVISSLSVLDND